MDREQKAVLEQLRQYSEHETFYKHYYQAKQNPQTFINFLEEYVPQVNVLKEDGSLYRMYRAVLIRSR